MTKEVAWTLTVWARKSTRDNKGHCVFFERPPKAEERGAVRRRWRTRVHQHLSILLLQLSFPGRKAGHFRVSESLPRPGRPIGQALAAATTLEECIERLSQSTTGMWLESLPPFPEPRPAKKKVPGAEPQGTIGPHQRKATNLGPLH